MGQLPTHNFSEGVYDHYMDISHVRFMEVMEVTNETCYMCPVRCKRAVKGTSPTVRSPWIPGSAVPNMKALPPWAAM